MKVKLVTALTPHIFLKPFFLFITAHQNARLFITHGGLLGIQEAIFFSVPLLGLPVINDQFINMVKLVKEGCGLSLEWTDINDHNLKTAITSLLQDPR